MQLHGVMLRVGIDRHQVGMDLGLSDRDVRRAFVVGVFDPRFQAQRGEDAEHDHQVVLGEVAEGLQPGLGQFQVHAASPRRVVWLRSVTNP
ncbi:hypothetical protein WHL33_14355, partial [Staphylococcus aureus]|uniref:hypothetical protein n=1 Tax=Staphylococcus aureus TaxID=1280 RepID=UPI0039BE0040